MKKMLKRLCTGFLALATVVTALPTTPVHAESKQYWTESKERVGIVEKVMNDGSIGSTFNEGHLTVEGEDAYCIDITSLDGKQLVTFEELYDLSNPDEPKKVTEHKDIDNEGQTITFKEKPEVPEEPEKPKTPQTPDTPHKTDSPKTGDNTNLYGLLALLLTSGAGLAGIFFCKRRKMKKS